MRMIVLDEKTDLDGLRARLLGGKAVSDDAIEKLKRLNPHVSFDRIPAGTVLLVPELPGLRKGETAPVTGDAFDSFRESLLAAVDATRARVRGSYEGVLGQQKEVTAVFKSAAFKRALESDPELREQVEAAAEVFKRDKEQAEEADGVLKEMRQEARDELAALGKLLEG